MPKQMVFSVMLARSLRSLNEENISDGLKLFLSGAGSNQRLELIKGQILTKLYAIQDLFMSQTRFRFYASSILILYDGISPEEIGSQVRI